MTISRFCKNFIPTNLPCMPSRSFAHKPTFGPPTQEISQLFREIKEWQLAKMLSENAQQPKVVLATFFSKEMATLETASKMKLHSSITSRIWEAIYPKKLPLLQETYTHALQDKMLKECTAREIDNMLCAYEQKGSITPEQDACLKKIYQRNRKSIQNTLRVEASKIQSKWLPELMRAAEKEGIEFPEATKF